MRAAFARAASVFAAVTSWVWTITRRDSVAWTVCALLFLLYMALFTSLEAG